MRPMKVKTNFPPPLSEEYQAITPKLVKVAEKAFLSNWWVLFFLLFCYLAAEQALKKVHKEHALLHDRVLELEKEKKSALEIQEELTLQVNSQSDQAWIELTLMKELGLVPEGQTKLLFTE